jgi:hypothetical protein
MVERTAHNGVVRGSSPCRPIGDGGKCWQGERTTHYVHPHTGTLSSVRIEREASNLNVGGSNPSVSVEVMAMMTMLQSSFGPAFEGAMLGATGLLLYLFSFAVYHEWSRQKTKDKMKDMIDERMERHNRRNHDDDGRR